MTAREALFSIGAVERDTGIGRDTLRVWERRYGFPAPLRNEKGERLYPENQLRRLQRIRRLLDCGMRPGKVLPLDDDDMDVLENSLGQDNVALEDEDIDSMLLAIQSEDIERIEALLGDSLREQGMEQFIIHTVAPLLGAVGERWARGELQIFQEHFLSQQLTRLLNSEISRMQKHAMKPLVLLATLPGETHVLGLLMVAAILSARGISAINLGAEVPMDQIRRAVNQFNADTVGVTFSSAYQYKHIRPHLTELRETLQGDVDIWIGGEGVRTMRKLPSGITRINSLQQLPL